MGKTITIWKRKGRGYKAAVRGRVLDAPHISDLEVLGTTALNSRAGLRPSTWVISEVVPGAGKRLLEAGDVVTLGGASYLYDGQMFEAIK